MFIVDNYALAVVLCIITMICWGSWGNTQKFVGKSWRFELFYWDYVIGMFLFSLLMAFTLGSHGSVGRDFLTDIQQISGQSWGYALLGGIIFNASNILLSASVSISGMSVAFPLGVGIALVLGVFINYLGTPKGNPLWLFTGVACVVLAIILNDMSANSVSSSENSGKNTNKGILLAALAGANRRRRAACANHGDLRGPRGGAFDGDAHRARAVPAIPALFTPSLLYLPQSARNPRGASRRSRRLRIAAAASEAGQSRDGRLGNGVDRDAAARSSSILDRTAEYSEHPARNPVPAAERVL